MPVVFCSLVATRTRGRMQRRTLAAKKRPIPLPRRCTNSADAGRVMRRAQRKVQNGRQQSRSSFTVCALLLLPPCHPATLTASPPCNLTALPPCHPCHLLPPTREKKRGAVYTTTRHSTIWALSLSLRFPLTDKTLVQKPKKTRGSFCYAASSY
jgi:hypothetical protein